MINEEPIGWNKIRFMNVFKYLNFCKYGLKRKSNSKKKVQLVTFIINFNIFFLHEFCQRSYEFKNITHLRY